MSVIQSLLETLKCCICLDNLTDAHMCPNCSKMCCQNCFKTWIDECKNFCPHCRETLSIADLVKCRWTQVVLEQLLKESTATEDKDDTCEQHGKKKKVYCKTCSVPICKNCAIWDKQHKHHNLSLVKEVYIGEKSGIQAKLDTLRAKLQKLEAQSDINSTQIEEFKNTKSLHLKKMKGMINNILDYIDTFYLRNSEDLTETNNKIGLMIESNTKVLKDTEDQLSILTYGQLIDDASSVKQKIEDLVSEPIPEYSSKRSVMCYIRNRILDFDCKEFVIENYPEKRYSKKYVYSDEYSENGFSWRLVVYPNGNNLDTHLSIYIELTSGPSQQFDFKIELVNDDEDKNISSYLTDLFEVGRGLGYRKFCEFSALYNSGFITDDSITFRFNLKCTQNYSKFPFLQSLI